MTEADWAAVYAMVVPHTLSATDVLMWRVGGAACVAAAILLGGIASVVNWRATPPGASKLPGQLVLLPAGIIASYGLWVMLSPTPDLDPFVVRGRCTEVYSLGHGNMAAFVEVQEAFELTPSGRGAARDEYSGTVSLGLEGDLDARVSADQEVVLLCHKSDACIGLLAPDDPQP